MLILLFFALLVFVIGFSFKTARNNDKNPYLWTLIGVVSFVGTNVVVTALLGDLAIRGLASITAGVLVTSFVINFLERRAMEG